jgi:hypothetical protein
VLYRKQTDLPGSNLKKNSDDFAQCIDPAALPLLYLPVEVRNGRGPTDSWVTSRNYDQTGIRLPSAFVGTTPRWRLLGGNSNALGGLIGSIRSLG